MTTVYVLKNLDGVVLYVGISGSALRRLGDHETGKAWWTDIARVELTHYEVDEDAAMAELTLIRTLRPLHNVAGQPMSPLVRGPGSSATPDGPWDFPVTLD